MTIDGEQGPFFGRGSEGETCFVVRSFSAHPHKSPRSTRELELILDTECKFTIDGSERTMLSNVLVCKSTDETELSAFIRLCAAFAGDDLNSRSMAELFSALTRMLTAERRSDPRTVSGLFGELYTIYYLDSRGIDVSGYWQRKDLMKFDFSLDPEKRMEVKTTSGQERRHHFRHEQLYYEDYDIMVVSVMLREANQGISVLDLANYGRRRYASDLARLSIIESRLAGHSDAELAKAVYDAPYLEGNIRFIPASEVPRFKEKSPGNLTNAEYDCNLDGTAGITLDRLAQWIP
ncbi:MAG: PD-(D/E)XK motif protein [Candidatus Methanomethylophilaceae archaeon]|nr:PD-(D/E)XK motif protein [Candidatus Methanomethylophilaceae archaeon]MBR6205205.1 PD-(D/E)XK motif protein [Candidatus Methanomethylophilaceae archaeon]